MNATSSCAASSRRIGITRLLATGAFLFSCLPAFAQVLTSTPRGIVVAHDGVLELTHGWRAAGVRNATAIVAGTDRVVVLDALHNEAVVADLATGVTTKIATAETPVAAAFAGRELYILARDARLLQHVGGRNVELAADPAFLAEWHGRIYVYSRAAGVLQEIGGRRIAVAPFASDLEVDGSHAFLAYPREGKLRVVDLGSGRISEIAVGAVPTDIAFAGGGTALTARILAVADPSSKRIWLTEATQSMAQAIARGFLRGFLGLGLFGSNASQFPTGVDRVETRGRVWVAYDSSSGTLYHFTRQKSTVLARGVAPHAFAVTDKGAAWWNGTSVAEKALR